MPFPIKLLAVASAGMALGLGALTFLLSEAPSYLSDKPETCINCHIMRPQYATWKSSSHRTVATCNDCHVPQDNFVRKYLFKGMDGTRHSFMFTFHMEPQVIRIHAPGAKVVQENCMRCHGSLVDGTAHGRQSFTVQAAKASAAPPLFPTKMKTQTLQLDPRRKCIDCHREVPHGQVDSLSSTPEVRAPRLKALGSQLLDRRKP